jgi:hypothetical protein
MFGNEAMVADHSRHGVLEQPHAPARICHRRMLGEIGEVVGQAIQIDHRREAHRWIGLLAHQPPQIRMPVLPVPSPAPLPAADLPAGLDDQRVSPEILDLQMRPQDFFDERFLGLCIDSIERGRSRPLCTGKAGAFTPPRIHPSARRVAQEETEKVARSVSA